MKTKTTNKPFDAFRKTMRLKDPSVSFQQLGEFENHIKQTVWHSWLNHKMIIFLVLDNGEFTCLETVSENDLEKLSDYLIGQ